uniref:TLDc domain-containing protein n=1 Tax=Vitrella brassicaformis TaxID=1169539 RepID=A0A7S1KE80_9ALVE|mmetsp:Transcript_50361/g.126154  ORF Transcript_50361/g.126154 Transcript_50361/m.126154 type:complete len:229 (+) Transcript_50361:121-807(+)
MFIRAVAGLLTVLCVAEAQQVHLRGLQVTPPEGTSLSASEYEGLVGLLVQEGELGVLGNATTKLTPLYWTAAHGTAWRKVLVRVGDAEPLVFIIRKDNYVFGAFISDRLLLSDDYPTDRREYESDVWLFSLAGHFPKPTKIDIDEGDHFVVVSGREGSLSGWANAEIGGRLYLGFRPYIRSCMQVTDSRYLPAGYTGERNEYGGAYLGGSYDFIADEIEVLHVVGNSR